MCTYRAVKGPVTALPSPNPSTARCGSLLLSHTAIGCLSLLLDMSLHLLTSRSAGVNIPGPDSVQSRPCMTRQSAVAGCSTDQAACCSSVHHRPAAVRS